VDSVFADAPERASDTRIRPLDPSARAAITALVRTLEVFDPAAARRAALRAHLVNRIASATDTPTQDLVDAITGSLLAEISIVLTHVRPVGTVDVMPDPGSAVLSASVLDRLPGLGGTAVAVRHQYERWDGSGGPHGLRGPDIPLAARLLALAATLVGHPQQGAAPNWTARRRRVDELLGTALDPHLGAIVGAELESSDPAPSTIEINTVLEGLEHFVPVERDSPVEALVSIGAAVSAADRMPDVLLVIAEQAKKALHSDTVTIGRLDHESSAFETLVNAGTGEGLKRFPVSELLYNEDRPGLDQILLGDGFVRAVDEGRADDPGVASLHRRGLRSEAAWPIVIGESIWGAVWASTHAGAGAIDHDDLAIAEFEELAHRDPLTGLANRRVLEEQLRRVFDRPAIDRQDVALIMCDVDGLKIVNDTDGHAAGDELLIEAANALDTAASMVEGSTTCRIGGDEFCIILDGGGMLSAQPVTDMALRLFAETGVDRSLSCGIALAGPDVGTPGELLRSADEAQYEQKRIRKGLPSLDDLSDVGDRRRTRRET